MFNVGVNVESAVVWPITKWKRKKATLGHIEAAHRLDSPLTVNRIEEYKNIDEKIEENQPKARNEKHF